MPKKSLSRSIISKATNLINVWKMFSCSKIVQSSCNVLKQTDDLFMLDWEKCFKFSLFFLVVNESLYCNDGIVSCWWIEFSKKKYTLVVCFQKATSKYENRIKCYNRLNEDSKRNVNKEFVLKLKVFNGYQWQIS